MKPLIDLHTHSVASQHAYSTLTENIKEAKVKGLAVYGLSDHAPGLQDTTCPAYFANLKVLPEEIGGVRLLKGVELNVLNPQGDVDLPKALISGLDYAIASIHLPCFEKTDTSGITDALINAMDINRVIMIGHPDDSRLPVDYERLVSAASEKKVFLEVNNSSLSPNAFRVGAYENLKIMLGLCEKYSVKVMMSSDAHFLNDVGRFDYVLSLMAEINFPKALVMNYDLEGFWKHIARCQNK